MKYVLAEITRRNIGFHYYREHNGNRAFVPYGTNGSIPLAISFQNGRYSLGKAALIAVEEGQEDAYYNLFDVSGSQPCFDGLMGGQLVAKVITLLLEDLCKDKFYSNLSDIASDITLALFYGNDISLAEIERVHNELSLSSLAEVKVFDHSQEAVKFFHQGTVDDWSGETDGMVVMSDNQDLSVKCYSLSDYSLKYEHRFQGKGVDPRFEWAVNMLWQNVKNRTYSRKEECDPIIKKTIKDFLDSDRTELLSLKLPDGSWPVMLTKRQYNLYSPPGGNQFVTIAGDVVQKAGLRYETTGIVLQGFAADNKSFRDSFLSFDPISHENEVRSCEIRNNILSVLMGFEEVLEVEDNDIVCPCKGGTLMVGVKSLPEDPSFTATSDDRWIKTLVGTKEVAIITEPYAGTVERVGVVTLTSPYKRITKTIVVRQNGKEDSTPDDSFEVDEKVVTLPWNGGTHSVGVMTKPEGQTFTAETGDSWIKFTVGSKEIAISAGANEGAEERTGLITLSGPYKRVTKTIEVRQPDNGNRKFKITSEVVTSGGLFKKTKKLKVNVEIMDDKALPFDCVFTLSKNYSIKFKPESMYYEECEPGAKGKLTFGPYTLPIPALGNTDVIYAGIWPAREMPGNPLFRNNQLEIKL